MIDVVNSAARQKRARGRPPAFDRNAALAAATRVFWQAGYEGASIADLTRAMKIAPQSLYAAFTSKGELYSEVLAWYQAEIGLNAAAALADADVVQAFNRMLMESARDFCRADRPKGCMISMGGLTCGVENEQHAKQVALLRRATVEAFRLRLEQGKTDGHLCTTTDTFALARFLGAVVQGMSVQARDGASEKDLASIARLAISELVQHQA